MKQLNVIPEYTEDSPEYAFALDKVGNIFAPTRNRAEAAGTLKYYALDKKGEPYRIAVRGLDDIKLSECDERHVIEFTVGGEPRCAIAAEAEEDSFNGWSLADGARLSLNTGGLAELLENLDAESIKVFLIGG